MKRFAVKILPFLIVLTVFGCRIRPFDDISTDGIDAEWALPLVDTERSFGDIIKGFDPQAFVQIAADGSIVLHYKGNFIARNSLDIFANFNNTAFPLTDTVMAVPFTLPSGVHVDYVDVKRGILNWGILIPSSETSLKVNLMIPQLTKNGVAFQKQFFVYPGFPKLDTLDMSGYNLTPIKDSIYIIHDARRTDGTRVNLASRAIFQIQNFEFKFAKGYFGQDLFDVPRDTIPIDFFQQWKDGQVRFSDPKLTVSLDNSFGVPVRAVMSVGDIISVDGSRLPLRSPLTAGVNVNYPTIQQVGQTKRTVIVFDKTNSNIADIISSNPVAIDYKIDGLINPDSNRTIVGFMTDTSSFKLQVELEVPMSGAAKNFAVTDTFKIDLSGGGKELTKAEFKILTDNGMPIDVTLQGYFATANGIVLDSMFTPQKATILRGAPVGNDGLPTGVSTAENYVTLDAAKLKKVRGAQKLIVRYAFSTTNGGSVPVKLKAAQSVRIRIGVKFGYKTS